MKEYFKLEDVSAYKIASELSDIVYGAVSKWNWFDKRTLGAQYVDATDSVGGNIAEGFGRYHKKNKIKFYYNARGSVLESSYWTKKADSRKLLTKEELNKISHLPEQLPKEINNLIRLTNQNLKL